MIDQTGNALTKCIAQTLFKGGRNSMGIEEAMIILLILVVIMLVVWFKFSKNMARIVTQEAMRQGAGVVVTSIGKHLELDYTKKLML